MEKGYSFIEMVVVVAVAGLVVAIGLASYVRFNQKQQVKAAAEAVAQELRGAQKRAISGDVAACSFGDSLLGYQVRFNTAGDNYQIGPRCPGFTAVKTITVEGADLTIGVTVDFDLDGRVDSLKEIELWQGGYSYRVCVRTSGEVMVTDHNCF